MPAERPERLQSCRQSCLQAGTVVLLPDASHTLLLASWGCAPHYASRSHPEAGSGHTADDVDAFDVDGPAVLTEYHHAVHQPTLRVISAINDITQRLGQAAYVRGLLNRS